MNTDENWKETRVLSEDLSTLLGVSPRTVEEFLYILEDLIVHKLCEEVNSSDGESEVSIELPYLGTLTVSPIRGPRGRLSLSTTFMVRKSLYNKIKRVYESGESPLEVRLRKVLGDRLVSQLEEGEE